MRNLSIVIAYMNDAFYNWYKIAGDIHDIEVAENGLATIAVNGKNICIAARQNKLLACAAKCPHAGAPLAEGHIDQAGNIVCPLHGYKFSLENGRNISGEGYFLVTYPVQYREDGIYIGLKT